MRSNSQPCPPPLYLGNSAFGTRRMSDTGRMQRMMGQVGGRRLTYRPLTDH